MHRERYWVVALKPGSTEFMPMCDGPQSLEQAERLLAEYQDARDDQGVRTGWGFTIVDGEAGMTPIPPECSICRSRHPMDDRHPCE